MPWGYLVFLTSVTLFTVAALVPARRARRARYLLAVSVNEIPHLFALGLILATGAAWAAGDLHGVTGLAATGLAGAVLAGLGELLRRGLGADQVVRDSLRRAGLPAAPRRPWSRSRALLTPLPLRPPAVRRQGGIAYGPHRRQRVDVYRRRGPTRSGPVLVYLHGGGYYSGGRRREGQALLHRLARRGWTCISAGYRLRPGADFVDHLDDARAALALAHQYADEHGGAGENVVMAGSSAGAHLSALCALTQHPSKRDSRVDAVICLYGYYGRYYGRGPDEYPVSAPLTLDPRSAPPFFLAHGDRDSWAPVEQARAFRDHLTSHSDAPVVFAELPDAQHGFDRFRSMRLSAVIDGIEGFLTGLNTPGRRGL